MGYQFPYGFWGFDDRLVVPVRIDSGLVVFCIFDNAFLDNRLLTL